VSLAFESLRGSLRRLVADTAVERSGANAGTPSRARITSIDLLRGLVMVIMTLDHTRDFFGAAGFNPRDVSDPALFLTRWITHFCAPTFILLAGISAFVYGAAGRSPAAVSRFLFTRGLWLVLIEFTLVRLAWTFTMRPDYFVIQVIFAIGASMIALATLVHLPRWTIAAFGLAMIGGHNLLDGVRAEQFGAAAPLWNVLHQPGIAPSVGLAVLYPLVPWIGVMAAGYALGPLFLREDAARTRQLATMGLAVAAGFVLLRASNLYGDPTPWSIQGAWLATILSFINCEKYPPSLLYLAMTLGPALLLLGAFEGARGRLADWITTFGRVPFFYYVVHIFLLHALALGYAWIATGNVGWLFGHLSGKPAGYGLGLGGIYAVWLAVVVGIYPLCAWFATIKRRRHEWWWSYL
jgi:uncharacterized membrane protein